MRTPPLFSDQSRADLFNVAGLASFLLIAAPGVGRSRIIGHAIHVRPRCGGIVAAHAGDTRRLGLPGTARGSGRMAHFAIANVLGSLDVPVSAGDGIGMADRGIGIFQGPAVMHGMDTASDGHRTAPGTEFAAALVVMAVAAQIDRGVVEVLVVARVIQDIALARGVLMAGTAVDLACPA